MKQENIVAPMPGNVISVEANVGDDVLEGECVIVIESMKMENPVSAKVSGTMRNINVEVGQVVQTGDVIAVIDYP